MITLSAFTLIFWLAYCIMHGANSTLFVFTKRRPVKGSHQAFVYYTIKKIVRILAGLHVMILLFNSLVPHVDYGDVFFALLCIALYFYFLKTDCPDDDNWFDSMKRKVKSFMSSLSTRFAPVTA